MGEQLPVPLSASKLKTFDACPKRFQLHYVDRLPAEGADNRYIRRGNAVHEAIESYLTDRDATGDDQSQVAFDLKREYWDAGGQQTYRLSDDDNGFVVDCLEVAARPLADLDDQIVAVEASLPFEDAAVDHAEGFQGYADLVTATEVWDWKTGSSDGQQLSETLQGAVYMAGFASHMGRPPDAVRFLYLKEEKQQTHTPSDEMYQTMRDKASGLLDAVTFGQFPADPGESKCHWCDYELHCSASPVGAGGISWRQYP